MIILGTILAKKRGDEPLKLGLDINCLRKSDAAPPSRPSRPSRKELNWMVNHDRQGRQRERRPHCGPETRSTRIGMNERF